MSLCELLADLVLIVHAAFSLFVVLGLLFILTGMILGWGWTNGWRFRTLHLSATLIVVARVWLGVPCPFSTAEDSLRSQAAVPCVFGPSFHDLLRHLAFRGNDPQRFTRSTTVVGIVVAATFVLNLRLRRRPPSKMREPAVGQMAPFVFFVLLTASAGRTNAAEERPLMREFIGINGHTVQFKPDRYQPGCRLVRDYHPVDNEGSGN
jgi:hypothetical protein